MIDIHVCVTLIVKRTAASQEQWLLVDVYEIQWVILKRPLFCVVAAGCHAVSHVQ